MDTWREKTKRYCDLAVSGEYKRLFRDGRFRVLVLADSERRMRFIRNAVADVTKKLFLFATLNNVAGEKFFRPAWLGPTGTEHQSIFTQSR
jgi:hypothetical protein